ncbi:FAD:protein FMN transferase [Neoroseomonas lacus]|uniref:FAD:protein FMN transferase n=1 Tax=Neoroseomonas lacus TaxID=287609 RepID=A0A917NYZ5_9PROT|nr:FAD:protein FMN transferase [Neoroseomonas lacus]GGJ42234.1 FAD:protein FMN transferase [Neoroseomonas lacus]
MPILALKGETMGTSWSVRCAAGADGDGLRAEIERCLDRVNAEMSGWRAGSYLCRFNRLPAGGSLRLPTGFRSVLEAALATAKATAGAFDPTVGPLVDLWGFGATPTIHEGPPPSTGIAAALRRVGWRQLEFDSADGGLHQPGGVALDLSGIAKGYAVDLVARALEAAGVNSYLIEVGGELRGCGVKPDGAPWWVALESPVAKSAPAYLVALHDLAIATSGDYRRYFRHGGIQYGHTLDPRSGWPIPPCIAAVTVLHRHCMQADALATALAVLGLPAGLEHATRHGIAALIVSRDGAGGCTDHLSPALAAMLG